MRILEGWARKVALPLLCLSAVGWIVYVVGFGLFYQDFSARIASVGSVEGFGSFGSFGGIPSILTRLYTPCWMFLGSGILMYLLSIPYLLYGNSFLGLATNFITAISLATGGIVLFETGFVIFFPTFTVSSNDQDSQYLVTTFAGCLIAEIFLAIYTLLWPFFVINPPEYCINLTEEDRRAFGGRHPYHIQPESSSQQPAYSQLAPTPPPSQGFSVLLWPFFIINPPEFCIKLTEDDRRAFSNRCPQHFQPDGSFQQPTFIQLAPLSTFPQAVQMPPVTAAVPGYMPAGLTASGPNDQMDV